MANGGDHINDVGEKLTTRMRQFLYVGYFVLLAGAAILTTGYSIGNVALAGISLLGFSVLASLLYIATASQRSAGLIAKIFLWAMVSAFTLVCVLLVSGALLGWPPQANRLIAKLLEAPDLIKGSDRVMDLAEVEKLNSQELRDTFGPLPDNFKDSFSRTAALKIRPGLRLQGRVDVSTLPLLSWAASKVILDNAVLVVGDKELSIETVDISAIRSKIVAFEDKSIPLEPSGFGGPGPNGKSAGSLTLIVRGATTTDGLIVDLQGTPGGPGAPGVRGADGAQGAQGDKSASSLFDCKRGPGRGRPGGPGQPGETGGAGGNGGNGGNLVLGGVIGGLQPVQDGGSGGRGGEGGQGGNGGRGGPGGPTSGLCSGSAPAGDAGPSGPTGSSGVDGAKGQPGTLIRKSE